VRLKVSHSRPLSGDELATQIRNESLNCDILRRVSQFCLENLQRLPFAFWILRTICWELIDEWEDDPQGIPEARFQVMKQHFEEPIIKLLSIEDWTPEQVMPVIDQLVLRHMEFRRLIPPGPDTTVLH